jgi:hypothetical protein
MNSQVRIFFLVLLFAAPIAMAQIHTVGVLSSTPAVFDGYTLLMPSRSKSTILIDNCGRQVHTWQSEYFPAEVAYVVPGGRLLRAAKVVNRFDGSGSGGRIEMYNWSGELIWGYTYNDEHFCQHHDIRVMPNGHILVVAWNLRSETETVHAGRDTSMFLRRDMWMEQVTELEPIGSDSANIVWLWDSWDHLVQDRDSTLPNYGIVADNPGRYNINAPTLGGIELFHFNAVDYNPQLDQILLCSPLSSEIYIVDHSTTTAQAATSIGGKRGKGGDFLYRWGNPRMYDHGSAADQNFFGQHNAHWIEPGLVNAGKIMVFNNGTNRPGGQYSSVDVIDPPISEDSSYRLQADGSFGPSTSTRIYSATPPTSLFSPTTSGAQTLPNGDVLVCESSLGRIFEIDQAGTIVWDYISPVTLSGMTEQGAVPAGNQMFRSYKYAASGPELQGFDLTPGKHLEQNPIFSACDSVAAVEELPSTAGVCLFSNPFDETLTIASGDRAALRVDIFNITGRMMISVSLRDRTTIETGTWARGTYIARVQGASYAPQSVRLIVKR